MASRPLTPLFFLICLQLLSTPARLEACANIVVLSGVFQAIYAVLVTMGGSDFDLLGLKLVSPFKDATTGLEIGDDVDDDADG